MRSGSGKEKYSDGTIFQGNYFRNKKSGKGKFKWANGDEYVG